MTPAVNDTPRRAFTLGTGTWRVFVAAVAVSLFWVSPAAADVSAQAPFTFVLDGRNELVGVAVAADGSRYVSDRGAGMVYRITPSGVVVIAATTLDRPAGLAIDSAGRLLIAEERAGRILRLEADGALTVLARGIKTPRWIAVGDDGSLHVAAHRLTSPDGADTSEARTIVRVAHDGALTEVATGIRQLQALLRVNGSLIAASKGLVSGSDSAGTLLRYALNADGTLAAPVPWISTGLKQPVGLAIDALGALYVCSKELAVDTDISKRAIGKVHPDRHVSDFAASLTDPQGLAIGADGALYLADGKSGRLYRFAPPSAPTLDTLPSFTNRTTIGLAGAAESGARIDVLVNELATVAAATADALGRFAQTVSLAPGALNVLHVFATAARGNGLTSPPASAQTLHDALPPVTSFASPPENAHVRGIVEIRAAASDRASAVAALAMSASGQALSPVVTPALPAEVATAAAAWDTRLVADGAHTLRLLAYDRAGNQSQSLSRSVLVDNTPPSTEITSGPSGSVTTPGVTFGFSGADNLTPPASLTFSWRLDDGAFSAFGSSTTVALDGLSPGPHTFEVKARDLAGNEAIAAARRHFTVNLSTLRVAISDPPAGATVPAGLLVVRGIVDGVADEVGVQVNNVAAGVRGSEFVIQLELSPGTGNLTATATAANGITASHTVGVVVVPAPAPTPIFRAAPATGAAPLTVAFEVTGLGNIAQVQLDADGDGVIDAIAAAGETASYTYATPGIYVATVVVVDTAGNRTVAKTVIPVVERAALDSALQTKWAALTTALARRDVEGALTVVADGVKDRYRGAFRSLLANLPLIAGDLRPIRLFGFDGTIAEYVTTLDRDGATFVHFVYFMQDADGIWKIVAM